MKAAIASRAPEESVAALARRPGIFGALFRDALAVAAGDYFSYGVMFILTVLISRKFGAGELGRFSLGFAVSSILILSTNNGFSAILKRDVAVDRDRAARYTGTFWALRIIILAVLGLAVAAGTSSMAHGDRQTAFVIWVVYFAESIDSVTEICFGVYQALDRMVSYSVARASQSAILLAGCSAALYFYQGSAPFYWVFVIVNAAFLLANLVFIRRFLRIAPRFDRSLLSYAFGESWPLIINAFAYVAYARVGILIVSYALGVDATGTYSACTNVLSGLAVIPAACGVVLFPRMSREFETQRFGLMTFIRRTTILLAAGGLLSSGLIALGAPWIVRVYGKLPPSAVETLRIMALGMAAQFAAPVSGYAFTAIRKQRDGMLFAGGMLVVSAVAYLLLTKLKGANGAAFAYVVSQVAWALGSYFIVRYRLFSLRAA